jgi:hypothetical protein
MLNQKRRLASAAIGMGLAIVAAGCDTTTVSNRVGNLPVHSSAASPTPPNPFTVVAPWSAASLGLVPNLGQPGDASLAIGPDGNLYTTDRSQRVTVISPDGRVLRRWGGPGSGPSQFHFITTDLPNAINGKIAVGSNGLVYVSDSGNARIQVFKLEGRHARFVREFGSFGDGPGQFLPADLAVDDAGNVYVTDDSMDTVSAFSAAGRLLWRIGGPTSDSSNHQFLGGFDALGRLVTLHDTSGGVGYLNQQGRKVDAFAVYPFPSRYACGISVDGLGNTYLTSCGDEAGTATEVFDHSHTLVGVWQGSFDLLAISPRFGPDGEIFALGFDGSLLKLRITLPQA